MNVGTARYWILSRPPSGHPPVLLEPTNNPFKAQTAWESKVLDVIDRGPINQWTGQPHPPHPDEIRIKQVERIEALMRGEGGGHGVQVRPGLRLEELDLDDHHAL